MTEQDNKTIILTPFPGFYNTIYEDCIDHELIMTLENITEDHGSNNLDTGDLIDIFDTRQAMQIIGREYIAALNDKTDLALEYESIHSPREYNFANDRLFAYINDADLLAMYNEIVSSEAGQAMFAQVLSDWFTPRSGFIPHYSNDPDDWYEKDLREWDHNEKGALLEAYIRLIWDAESSRELEMDVFDSVSENVSGNGLLDECWQDEPDTLLNARAV